MSGNSIDHPWFGRIRHRRGEFAGTAEGPTREHVVAALAEHRERTRRALRGSGKDPQTVKAADAKADAMTTVLWCREDVVAPPSTANPRSSQVSETLFE